MRVPLRRCSCRAIAIAAALSAATVVPSAQTPAHTTPDVLPAEAPVAPVSVREEVTTAMTRLALAGALGTALALRPKRLGTPERTMPVLETQIILAIVGALIMLVVGASLARAFGIVGAANLIRYRAKIENPKDAVVMLATLAVGLACGVGLYALSVVGTIFVGAALWIIEGFEPAARKAFDLNIAIKKGDAADLRPAIENVLRRYHTTFELRASADDAVSYAIDAPRTMRVDRVSSAIERLAPDDAGIAVEWAKKDKKAS